MSKQEFLPGQKPKRIAGVIDAADEYLKIKDTITAHKRLLEEAEVAVRREMERVNLQAYFFGGVVIEIEEKEKVKIKREAQAPTEREFPDRKSAAAGEGASA